MTIARVIKKDAPNDFSKLKFSNRKIPEKHEITGADFFSGPSYLRFTYRFVTKRVLGMISLILGSRFRKTRNFGGENSSFHLQKLEFWGSQNLDFWPFGNSRSGLSKIQSVQKSSLFYYKLWINESHLFLPNLKLAKLNSWSFKIDEGWSSSSRGQRCEVRSAPASLYLELMKGDPLRCAVRDARWDRLPLRCI